MQVKLIPTTSDVSNDTRDMNPPICIELHSLASDLLTYAAGILLRCFPVDSEKQAEVSRFYSLYAVSDSLKYVVSHKLGY